MAKINSASASSFFSKIGISNKTVLDVLADLTKEKWLEFIRLGWYELYDPWVYERQYAILQSIMRTNVYEESNNSYRVDIYVDFTTMNRFHPNSQGEWDGQQVFQAIETDGFSMSNGINRDPSYAMENTKQWLEDSFKKFLLDALRRKGYDIK